MKSFGKERDYIKIQYADEEMLYVPIEQANLVQRYIGSEGGAPKLDKLGGTGWAHKKAKARKSAEDLAGKLIDLYAKRKNSVGFAFQKDTDWQLQFEASFPYDETPDQLSCIEDIKSDMLLPRTDTKAAEALTDVIQGKLSQYKVQGTLMLTASFGIATTSDVVENANQLVSKAEDDLEARKIYDNNEQKGNVVTAIVNSLHAADQQLSRLLVFLIGEGGVFLGEHRQGILEFHLVVRRGRFDGYADHRVGKVHFFEKYLLAFAA